MADAADDLARWAAALQPQWRAPVERALSSRQRYLGIVAGLADGPTKQRLTSLVPTMDLSVQRIADAVWRASNARSIAEGFDADAATAELKAARRDLAAQSDGGGDTTALQARVDALAQRHRAINEALNLAEDSGSALEEMNLRLETAVAHAEPRRPMSKWMTKSALKAMLLAEPITSAKVASMGWPSART